MTNKLYSKNDFEQLLEEGYNLCKRGFVDDALNKYKKALKLNPNDERVHYYLGYLYEERKEYLKAIKEYKKAIKINPKNYLSYNNLGLALQKHGELNEAIRVFKKTIELNPKSYLGHFNIGRLYALNKEQFKESIEELEKSITLNATHISSYYGIGYAYEKIGDKKKAIEMYKKILKLQPRSKVADDALKRLARY